MSAGPTLNSRLRVLVAKAYKAEKLYASIRNQPGGEPRVEKPSEHSGEKGVSGSATLSVFANDVRAKEWQRSHFQLRTALNEILAESAGARTIQELLELRDRFGSKAAECTALVERETGELLEIARRKEFAHCLKLALDLVRHNARAQAYSVIVSELNGILDSTSSRTSSQAISSSAQSSPSVSSVVASSPAADSTSVVPKQSEVPADGSSASNVIPFSRRAVSGRRR